MYAILTDNSAAATTGMQALGATSAHVFANHTLWLFTGADPYGGKGTSPPAYVTNIILLPNPL